MTTSPSPDRGVTDRAAAILAAIESWPARAWLVLPGPTDLAPNLAAHIAGLLAHPDDGLRDALRALHRPETVTGLLCEESCECVECEAGGCEACVDGLGHTNMVCVHCYGADQDGYASRMIWPCETAALLTEDGTR